METALTTPPIVFAESQSTTSNERPDVDAPPEVRPYLFSADQFTQMVESDLFPRESRVELWDGKVYEKMAKRRAHSVSGTKMNYTFVRILPEGWYCGQEESLTLDGQKVPLPDLMVVRGTPEDYPDANPTTADVGLVVELSYTSLRSDTGPKLRGYAKAGIPQYWVANLVANVLLVHRDPLVDESRYGTVETYRHGEAVPLFLDGVEILRVPVSDILRLPRV